MNSRASISGYDAQAKVLSDSYESVEFQKVHGWLLPLLKNRKGSALDIGAGSGRDANALIHLGFDVVAVEPSAGMRGEGRRRHPDSGIVWVDDALPEIGSLYRQALSFDLILASAVWMHVSPEDRPRAFRNLVSLLNPGGILAMTLKTGPPEENRPMFETSIDELENLARDQATEIIWNKIEPDRLERPEVTWSHIAFATKVEEERWPSF